MNKMDHSLRELREIDELADAYPLRASGQRGIHHFAWGSFLGQPLLRSMDRAQELYGNMQLRGFQGKFHYARVKPCPPRGAAFFAVSVAAFLEVQWVLVARLLGSPFLR